MAREKDADRSVRGKPSHQLRPEDKAPTRAIVIVPVLTRQPRGEDETN
ncbi:MAG: GTPase HflX, partial [Mesorhizobium sp.]